MKKQKKNNKNNTNTIDNENNKNVFHVGDKVHFKRHVFQGTNVPHYDEYRGHQFEIVSFHYGDHLELKCLTGDVKVKGYVETYDVRRAR